MARLSKERSYFVAKDNQLITKSRYSMTFEQQRLLLYAISRIRPHDNEKKVYKFTVKELSAVCGYDDDVPGAIYKRLQDDIKKIADLSAWIEISESKARLFRWLDGSTVDYKRGEISLTFHESVAQYLFGLEDRYTQYPLFNILGMASKYSIRLYELLSAMKGAKQPFCISIDELKVRLGILSKDEYQHYGHFYSRVLEPALSEIDIYTDLSVVYIAKKTGRAYTDAEFYIAVKKAVSYFDAMDATNAKLNNRR